MGVGVSGLFCSFLCFCFSVFVFVFFVFLCAFLCLTVCMDASMRMCTATAVCGCVCVCIIVCIYTCLLAPLAWSPFFVLIVLSSFSEASALSNDPPPANSYAFVDDEPILEAE